MLDLVAKGASYNHGPNRDWLGGKMLEQGKHNIFLHVRVLCCRLLVVGKASSVLVMAKTEG
jgi:hypothetical protein